MGSFARTFRQHLDRDIPAELICNLIMPERFDNHLRDPPMVDTGGGSQMFNRNELGCRNKEGNLRHSTFEKTC